MLVSPIPDDSARSQSVPSRGRQRLNRIGQVSNGLGLGRRGPTLRFFKGRGYLIRCNSYPYNHGLYIQQNQTSIVESEKHTCFTPLSMALETVAWESHPCLPTGKNRVGV